MARVPAQTVREVLPQGTAPDRYQRVSSEPANFGPGIGGGLEALGAGALQAADFFNRAAADDAANQYQEGVNKILYGDPNTKRPNGEPDTGYMGLKGRAALDERPAVETRMEELRKKLRGGLYALKSDLDFDNYTRRFKAITDAQVGNHARTQANVYATHVNTATSKVALDDIAINFDDPDMVQAATQRLIAARVKQAELNGGGPELINEAFRGALRDGLTARLQAIAVKDPARAIQMLEKEKAAAGSQYDNLYNSFRARAGQQEGREEADIELIKAMPGGVSPEAIQGAIVGTESGGQQLNQKGTILTSSKGALGIGQIIPETFARFALPGERIDRKEDNLAVSNRMVRKFYRDYGGDWQRVAVAYFSGEGNVAEPGSSRPYKNNWSDGHNTVAQYIAKVGGRLAKTAAPAAAVTEFGDVPDSAVAGGTPAPMKTQADLLEEGRRLFPDKPEARAAYIARINESYAIENSRRIKEKAAFKTRIDNGVAEAMDTGKPPSDPIPEADFIKQYGAEGPVMYQKYNNEIQFGAIRHSFEEMPDSQIRQTIDLQKPMPGSATYANEAGQVQKLREYADKLQKQRLEDPGGTVLRQAPVREAAAQYDPKRPETYRPVAEAMLAAQERLEIDPENRAPMPKAMALELTMPLMRALGPAQQLQALQELGVKFRAMFGENAGLALGYAMRARSIHGELAENAAALMGELAQGKPLTSAEKREFKAAQDNVAADRAVRGEAPVAQRWMFDNAPGVSTSFDMMQPSAPQTNSAPRQYPPPNSTAIQNLIGGKMTEKQFDTLFGPGAAKQLRERPGMSQLMRQAEPDGR